MLLASFLHAKDFPDSSVTEGFEGKKVIGVAKLNGTNFNVSFSVNENQLAIKSVFPRMGLILDLEELAIWKEKSLIGHRVKVISGNHMIEELFISTRVAKKLKEYSNGKFPYIV
jgi:hypothetical protein